MVHPFNNLNFFKPLYQYTSSQGLIGILRSRSMWLSDLRSMNDPRELVFGQEFFLPLLDQWCRDRMSGKKLDFTLKFIEDHFYADIKFYTFFSASFCNDPDSRHLWKEYAKNEKGVSIGFNHNILKIMGHPFEVKYLNTTKKDTASMLINAFDEHLNIEFLRQKDFSIVSAFESFSRALRNIYVASKDAKWQPENEIRVVWLQRKPEFQEEPLVFPDGKKRYFEILQRESNFGQVDYIAKPFSTAIYSIDHPKPIVEVVLGRRCRLEIDEVKSLAEQLNYPPFHVRRSGSR